MTKTITKSSSSPLSRVCALYTALVWGTSFTVCWVSEDVEKSEITRHIWEGGREQVVDSYCGKLACINFKQSTYIYLGNMMQKGKWKSPLFSLVQNKNE